MYHAGTPDSVKEHILQTITSVGGHIRVLICTVAFGMGVNCQYISRVIHFGGSQCVECYLQECGRAGRQGQSSFYLLLYNGILMKNCEEDIKNYAVATTCRRHEIASFFPKAKSKCSLQGCKCCDVCAKDCSCSDSKCLLNLFLPKKTPNPEPKMRCIITMESKTTLKDRLESYRLSLLPENLSVTPVSCPTMFLEFTEVQVSQVMKHCDKIFSLQDVKHYGEIWRDVYANNILAAIYDVFQDFHLNTEELILAFQGDLSDIWDDQSNASFFGDNSSLLENLDRTDTQLDESVDTINVTSTLNEIAEQANANFTPMND